MCIGGACRAQFGSKSFSLTQEQASSKALLQKARSINSPQSLDHARSLDSVPDLDESLNDGDTKPQAAGTVLPANTKSRLVLMSLSTFISDA